MTRDGDDPDEERGPDRDADDDEADRTGTPDDADDADERERPTYTWEGGEPQWRNDHEQTDGHESNRRTGGSRDGERRDDTRRDGQRPDRRGAPPRTGSPPRETSPRKGRGGEHGRPPATGTDVQTRDGVVWNFDSQHPHQRARRDEYERRRRREHPPSERGRRADGVKHIDFERKGAFDFAFSYPVQRGWGALLKAGAVVLFSPLLVFLPLVFLFGYVFRLTRYAAQGRTQPAFEDYGDMLTDGVGYVVVFTLASTVWLVGVIAGAALHEAVAWIFALVGFYLFPAALTVYPVTGSVTRTFSSSLTFDFAFTKHYLKYYLLYILLLVVLRIVTSFSILLFVIGVAWGWAFTYLANGAYWGNVYYKGARSGVLQSAEDVDQRNGY